ncbi:unnamed protein product [Tetraodon nigroviridis]|uniref:(spotted green pufferfish) hypothetical protein n=1 Tax=Tetraodon nigroviridis TaxID=99883 RepID=Q4RVR4_TETNG|nr:unnamed protein product [Tetraodon nigroviridis]
MGGDAAEEQADLKNWWDQAACRPECCIAAEAQRANQEWKLHTREESQRGPAFVSHDSNNTILQLPLKLAPGKRRRQCCSQLCRATRTQHRRPPGSKFRCRPSRQSPPD